MAKSKKSPALFEVISSEAKGKGSDRLAVPKWWQKTKVSPAVSPSTRESGSVATSGQPTTNAASPERPAPPSGKSQLVQVRSGRLEVSLSPVNAVVVAGALCLALFCSYLLGRLGGGSPGQLEASRGNEELFDENSMNPGAVLPSDAESGGHPAGTSGGPGGASGGSETRTVQAARRTKGLNYVILQTFASGDRAEAEHAREWFAGKGMAATIEEDQSGKWWVLLGMTGFDYGHPTGKQQCEEYMAAVKTLGKEYRNDFKGKREIRYNFDSPYAMKF